MPSESKHNISGAQRCHEADQGHVQGSHELQNGQAGWEKPSSHPGCLLLSQRRKSQRDVEPVVDPSTAQGHSQIQDSCLSNHICHSCHSSPCDRNALIRSRSCPAARNSHLRKTDGCTGHRPLLSPTHMISQLHTHCKLGFRGDEECLKTCDAP